MNRRDIILNGLNLSGQGLEIGPSFRPLLPKSAGYKIQVADHANAEDLRTKYREVPGAAEQIEEVDYVISDTLASAVGPETRFDYIIASHVIEHVPDLIRFLTDCEQILTPNGKLSLAIPDMRFCFDAARSITGASDVIRAFDERKTKPDKYDALDYYLNAFSKGGAFGWHQGYDGNAALMFDLPYANAQSLRAANEYIDVHCWRFTPVSFHLLVSDLRHLGYINFQPISQHGTIEHEFYVMLQLGGSLDKHQTDRMKLLADIIDERQLF